MRWRKYDGRFVDCVGIFICALLPMHTHKGPRKHCVGRISCFTHLYTPQQQSISESLMVWFITPPVPHSPIPLDIYPLKPLLMISPQIHLLLPLQIPRQISRPTLLLATPPVSKPREAIDSLRLPLPILPSRFLAHPVHMTRASGPVSMDPPAGLASVRPARAVVREDGSGEEGVAVVGEVVGCGLAGRKRANALVGHFAQDFGDVGRLRFDLVGYGSGRAGGVGTLDVEHVGEFGAGETEVGERIGCPGILEGVAVGGDGKWWEHVDVGTGRADYSVDFSCGAIFGDDAVGGEVGDGIADEGDVGTG